MTSEINKINNVFLLLSSDADERLARGLERREQLKKEITDGSEVVDNARTKWILNSAEELLANLKECALSFNEDNRDDLISIHDIGDVVATLSSWIEEGLLDENIHGQELDEDEN